MKLKILTGLYILITISFNLYSDNNSNTGAEFLNINTQPRPMALGESFTAIANDINALYYNPAGIINVKNKQAALMYKTGVEDIYYGGLAYINPLSSESGLGFNFNFFHLGSMDFYHPDGTIENLSIGNSFIFGISYAHLFFNDSIAFGSTLKLISSSLVKYSANSGAFNFGLLWYNSSPFNTNKDGISIGIVLQNLGLGLKYIDESDTLPITAKLGLAYIYHFLMGTTPLQLITSIDVVNRISNNQFGLNTGMELTIWNLLSLRTGYQINNVYSTSGFSTGLGIKVSHYQIDYALKLNNTLVSLEHCFAFSYIF